MTSSSPHEHGAVFERYFTHAHTLRRLKSGPGAHLVADFTEHLEAAGYARPTVLRHICSADHLSRWCHARDIDLRQLDAAALVGFIEHLPTCSCLINRRGVRRNTRIGARVFYRYLQSCSVVSPPPHEQPEVPAVLAGFLEWSRRDRGLADSTLATYARHISEFIEDAGPDPEQYGVGILRAFVLDQTKHPQPHRAQQVVCVLRAFVKYLVVHGKRPASLQSAIPRVARWRFASLPRYLPPEDVERLISTCDRSTRSGRRDRAMFLLLARLGLRAGEVSGLCLGDLDWAKGRLRVFGKGRRESYLPLPQDVGDAILAYLKDGRPAVDDDHVFLREQPPIGPYRSGSALSYIVRQAMQRAGVHCSARGAAHLLRHSLASNLLRQGATLDSIGVLFRHHSNETTALYSKVDVDLLRQVAQPWPGMD
jgi:integrase/recombinase XerD